MQSLQGIYGIEDSSGDLICIIDPISFIDEASEVPFDSLIHCKYCKSYVEIIGVGDKSECRVCKCWNDIKRMEGLEDVVVKLNSKGDNDRKLDEGFGNVFVTSTGSVAPVFKLIIVIESRVCSQIVGSLQCLQTLLSTLVNLHICLIIYDNEIRLIELQYDGRVLVVNSECMQIINDKIYDYGNGQCLKRLLEIVGQDWGDGKVLLNGSRVVCDVIGGLEKNGIGLVLWFGNVDESTVFCEWPQMLNIEIYPILIIPKKFKLASSFSSIQKRNVSRLTTKYILDDDKIGDKIHYYLWEIFGNYAILGQRIEASHEKKFQPQILSTKRRVLGSFKNSVIVNMGKTMNKNEMGQVRIWFMGSVKQEDVEEGVEEGGRLLGGKQGYRLLVINFGGQIFERRPRKQLQRYMQLFRLVRKNPTNMQLRQINYHTDTLVDISQFLMECSYLQKHEIQCSIQNIKCIYVVWPWIGMKRDCKDKRDSIKLLYYFTGYYCDRDEGMDGYLQDLNRDLYMPRYYQNIMEQIAPPSHLIDSDQESQIQGRYYKYYVD